MYSLLCYMVLMAQRATTRVAVYRHTRLNAINSPGDQRRLLEELKRSN